MGKFKTIFAACLSLGVVAGAGYYIYRKFARKYEKKGDDNLTQVKKKSQVYCNSFYVFSNPTSFLQGINEDEEKMIKSSTKTITAAQPFHGSTR